MNQYVRSLEFGLVLENVGTAPADDVDVLLWTDVPGRWLAELADLPAPPVVPKRRSIHESLVDFRPPVMPAIDFSSLRQPADNVDGPSIADEASGHTVLYTARRVKHHVPCALAAVYFQFDSDEVVASLP